MRGHTPQDHKPPPKVEQGFLCAHPALTRYTRYDTHNDSAILSVDDFDKSRSQSEIHKLSPRKLTVG